MANENNEAEREDCMAREVTNRNARRLALAARDPVQAVHAAAAVAVVAPEVDDELARRQLAAILAARLDGVAVRLGGRVTFFVYAHPLGPEMAELTKGFFLFPYNLGRRFGWAQLAQEDFHNIGFVDEAQHRLWNWMKRDAKTMLGETLCQEEIDSIVTEDYLYMEFERSQAGLFTSTLRFGHLMEVRNEVDEFTRLSFGNYGMVAR
jgi:hypothetical protein